MELTGREEVVFLWNIQLTYSVLDQNLLEQRDLATAPSCLTIWLDVLIGVMAVGAYSLAVIDKAENTLQGYTHLSRA